MVMQSPGELAERPDGVAPGGEGDVGVSAGQMVQSMRMGWGAISAVVMALAGMLLILPSAGGAAPGSGGPVARCVSDTTALLPASPGGAQRPAPRDTATLDTVAPGVTYACRWVARGPWLVHVVAIDLASRRWLLEGERAHGTMLGRERVSAMAERLSARGRRPLAAINADFFDLQSGEVENNHVVNGEWVKGVVVSDSPHDAFDNAHTQFAFDTRGAAHIGRFTLDGSARGAGRREPLVGINHRPPGEGGLVLYTPWYGARTLRDTLLPPRPERPAPTATQLRADSVRRATLAAAREAVEVALVRVRRAGESVEYRVARRRVTTGGGSAIPRDGAVLSATGDARSFVRALARRGGRVVVRAALRGVPAPPRAVVGGWPGVVRGGVNVGALADSIEGTFPRFSAARHPRSAIALTRDGATLLLVVVDGRRPWSAGMTLGELGELLVSLGAGEGMNLDGGGSSALWLDGAIVNFPSDPAGERAVGNALLVVPAPGAGR